MCLVLDDGREPLDGLGDGHGEDGIEDAQRVRAGRQRLAAMLAGVLGLEAFEPILWRGPAAFLRRPLLCTGLLVDSDVY